MNNVKYKFNNKVAVVTGAGSGIGYDVARILYNSGAKVILLGRSKNVKDKARLLNKSFERIEYYILDLSKDEKVISAVQDQVDLANSKVAQVQQIKKFTILENEWTDTSGELTPTLKLKRNVIADTYNDEIESMYKED